MSQPSARIQIGFHLPNYRPYASRRAIATIARQAEALGYDALWVADHVALPASAGLSFGEHVLDGLSVLAYAAALTERVTLGISVLILPYRSPLLTARLCATVDELAGGRLIVGVGCGYIPFEFAALGVPLAERGRRTDEAIRVLRTVWANPVAHFVGEFTRFEGLAFRPPPAQPGGPPIWVGGNSAAAIRRAARLGDAWHPLARPPAVLVAGLEKLRHEAAQAGRPAPPVTVRAQAELTEADQPPSRLPFQGSIRQWRQDLAAYKALGVTHVVIAPATGSPPAQDFAALQTFCTQVAETLLPFR